MPIIKGTNGNDTLSGGESDTIEGSGGNDTLSITVGATTPSVDYTPKLNGGSGNDFLTVDILSSSRNASMKPGINGGSGDDTITASADGGGQIHAWGELGNDTFYLDLTNTRGRKDTMFMVVPERTFSISQM